MNIPQITAMAGVQVEGQGGSLASLVKERLSPQPKLKNDDEPFVVFLTFDLTSGEIRFEDPRPLRPDTQTEFNYFGNNKAAESQYYLVREMGSLVYLLSTVWNDLALLLDKYGMEGSDLRRKLQQMETAGLVTITGKKGAGTVSFQKLFLPNSSGEFTHIEEKKKAVVGEDKFPFEELVRRALGVTRKKTRFLLTIPALRCPGEPLIIFSQHPDYLALVGKVNRLENTETKQGNNTGHVCSICRSRKPDVNSGYSVSLSRTGVNKIFTTTTINYASKIEKSGYDRTYAVCNGCYQKLRSGEAVIERQFRTRIAGENAFVLPEGIIEPLSYNYIEKLKNIADFAFHSRDAAEWFRSVEAEALEAGGLYALNLIVYRTDGNSVSVLQTIEDVPLIRLQLVMRLFAEGVSALHPHVRPMSLGSVYHLIPVRKTEKGQVNVQRVLSFYKSLLSGEMVYSNTLVSYAVEALDKGLRQLSKQKLDNYENLNLAVLRKAGEFYGARFILMTATQPQILEFGDLLLQENGRSGEAPLELLQDHKRYFSQNRRTKLVSLLKEKLDTERFTSLIADYRKPGQTVLVVVNTIRRSIELYHALKKQLEKEPDDPKILYLSTNIIPMQRKQTIKDAKELLHQKKPVVMVSTQTIEAGVDLDFDLGFRDLAPLESLIQIAGRVNREGEKGEYLPVYIVSLEDDAQKVYAFHHIDRTRALLEKREEIPENEYGYLVQEYYNQTLRDGVSEESRHIWEEGVMKVDFEVLQDFKLIDNIGEVVDVFVEIPSSKDSTSLASRLADAYEEVLTDRENWNLEKFIGLIDERILRKMKDRPDFFQRKALLKVLRSKINDYVIQVRKYRAAKNSPVDFSARGGVKSNLFWIPPAQLEDYYDFETGFKDESGKAFLH